MTPAIYLAAIVAANLTIAVLGPAASIITAFLLIGLDLVLRDRLHDAWLNDHLFVRMGALIAAGGVISYALNPAAASIAIASTVAFTVAAIVDTLAYHALRRLPFQVRANGSNVPAALADSILFPTLAFGGFLWPVVLGQFVAKTAGGALWAFLIAQWRKREALA